MSILIQDNLWVTYKIASRSTDCSKLDDSFFVQFIIVRARFPERNIFDKNNTGMNKTFQLHFKYICLLMVDVFFQQSEQSTVNTDGEDFYIWTKYRLKFLQVRLLPSPTFAVR